MKAILYFVAAGIVRDGHRDAATAINRETGKKVVFRNSDTAENEKPEANEGVAGRVPSNYESFTKYSDSGKVTAKGEIPAPSSLVADRPLNAIGLPDGEGCPEDRDALKAALEAEGIEFHANAKTEKLVELYLAHFYPESGAGEGADD